MTPEDRVTKGPGEASPPKEKPVMGKVEKRVLSCVLMLLLVVFVVIMTIAITAGLTSENNKQLSDEVAFLKERTAKTSTPTPASMPTSGPSVAEVKEKSFLAEISKIKQENKVLRESVAELEKTNQSLSKDNGWYSKEYRRVIDERDKHVPEATTKVAVVAVAVETSTTKPAASMPTPTPTSMPTSMPTSAAVAVEDDVNSLDVPGWHRVP